MSIITLDTYTPTIKANIIEKGYDIVYETKLNFLARHLMDIVNEITSIIPGHNKLTLTDVTPHKLPILLSNDDLIFVLTGEENYGEPVFGFKKREYHGECFKICGYFYGGGSNSEKFSIEEYNKKYPGLNSQLNSILAKYIELADQHACSNYDIEFNYFIGRPCDWKLKSRWVKRNESNIALNLFRDVDVNILMETFFKSNNKLLILNGVPGVGKSKLAFHIATNNPDWDNILHIRPGQIDKEMFISRVRDVVDDDDINCIIIDDLNPKFLSRNSDNDEIYDVLLDLLDGVYCDNDLKIIITTNFDFFKGGQYYGIPDEYKETPLFRDGRFFDLITIRELEEDQIKKYLTNHDLNIKIPDNLNFKEYNTPAKIATLIDKLQNNIPDNHGYRPYIK